MRGAQRLEAEQIGVVCDLGMRCADLSEARGGRGGIAGLRGQRLAQGLADGLGARGLRSLLGRRRGPEEQAGEQERREMDGAPSAQAAARFRPRSLPPLRASPHRGQCA